MSEAYAHPNYVKIWIWLLVLLALSVAGPMLEIPTLTIITAFGIAIVKAFLVAANFMHLKFEKKIIWFLLLMSICMLGVFFFARLDLIARFHLVRSDVHLAAIDLEVPVRDELPRLREGQREATSDDRAV